MAFKGLVCDSQLIGSYWRRVSCLKRVQSFQTAAHCSFDPTSRRKWCICWGLFSAADESTFLAVMSIWGSRTVFTYRMWKPVFQHHVDVPVSSGHKCWRLSEALCVFSGVSQSGRFVRSLVFVFYSNWFKWRWDSSGFVCWSVQRDWRKQALLLNHPFEMKWFTECSAADYKCALDTFAFYMTSQNRVK